MLVYVWRTGGGVPVFDEVLLLSQRMNSIESLDATSGTHALPLSCGQRTSHAGCAEWARAYMPRRTHTVLASVCLSLSVSLSLSLSLSLSVCPSVCLRMYVGVWGHEAVADGLALQAS
jgi:hypothetical protein